MIPLTGDRSPAAIRMLECLEMYDEGVEIQTLNFRRRFPHLSEIQLAVLVQRWLERSEES